MLLNLIKFIYSLMVSIFIEYFKDVEKSTSQNSPDHTGEFIVCVLKKARYTH